MQEFDKKILILGGTREAYSLSKKFYKNFFFNVISSLAGRTKNPLLPFGEVRIGGFGGIKGIQDYIREEKIKVIIDATHPFAQKITENAIFASKGLNIPFLQIKRPQWKKEKKDQWIEIGSLREATSLIPRKSHVFLAIGSRNLSTFYSRHDVKFVARIINYPKNFTKHQNFEFIFSKPQTKEEELKFFMKKKFDFIVCRNSGGKASYGKVLAARELSIPIFMITKKEIKNQEHSFNENEIFEIIKRDIFLKRTFTV